MNANNRDLDRKSYCLCCSNDQDFPRIIDHYKYHPAEEPQAKEALAERDPKERTRLLALLPNMGNYRHNCTVEASQQEKVTLSWQEVSQRAN